MRTVGLDQSFSGFGFSVDREAKKRSFPPGRHETDIHRLIYIRSWFTQWLELQNRVGIDLVAMEGYASNSKYGREISGELGAVVKMAVLDVTGHPPLIVPPTSLKKFVTGSGAGKKNVMLAHVYKKWGVMFTDDNQADAYSLEMFGDVYLDVVENGNAHVYKKYEVEAVEAVRKLV